MISKSALVIMVWSIVYCKTPRSQPSSFDTVTELQNVKGEIFAFSKNISFASLFYPAVSLDPVYVLLVEERIGDLQPPFRVREEFLVIALIIEIQLCFIYYWWNVWIEIDRGELAITFELESSTRVLWAFSELLVVKVSV